MRFSPALPDPRRAFSSEHRSRFVIDVNGQESHAVGDIVLRDAGDEVQVDLVPVAPEWTLDRPMSGTIRFDPEGRVDGDVKLVPVGD